MVVRAGKTLIVAMLVGSIATGGVFTLNQQLAHGSLSLVGYLNVPLEEPRPWWVEAYDYAQGLLWARRIAKTVAPASLSDEERVTRLAVWVFDHFLFIENDSSLPLQEDHFFNTARRGYGYCDQLAHVLATLYWAAGYPTRLLMLRDAQGVSIHTVTEVRLNNRWIAADPFYDILLRDWNGRLMGVEDLPEHPEWQDAYRAAGGATSPWLIFNAERNLPRPPIPRWAIG